MYVNVTMNRLSYSALLQWKRKEHRKPLLLKGVRQCGKTWLLKEFGRREFRRVHYVNFEKVDRWSVLFRDGPNPKSIVDQLAILLDVEINIQQDVLILDEIQLCEPALTSLKYFREEMPALAICAAGSHIGLIMGDGSFPVGQVDQLTLFPMNFLEFVMAVDPRAAALLKAAHEGTRPPDAIHARFWELLTWYFVTGGLPEVVTRFCELRPDLPSALREARVVQKNLLTGYQSDFSKHAGKENASHINRVFEHIPAQLAKVMDGHVMRFRFRDVVPGRERFSRLRGPLDWLDKSGLLIRVYPVDQPVHPLKAQTRENIFKVYLFDVGMLGCMLDLPLESILDQDYGSYKGWFAENLVAQEWRSAGRESLYSWSGRESEIEFLSVRGKDVRPVEVKSGSRSRSKSLSAYQEKYKPPLRIKITARNLDVSTPGCHNVPLYLAAMA